MVIEIELTKGKTAIIDDVDRELSEVSWFAQANKGGLWYAGHGGGKGRKTLLMHREILSRSLGRPLQFIEKCDHINGNGLDNRRSNLRIATCAQNLRNQRRRTSSSSQYKGVSWKYWNGKPGKVYSKGKWRAQIMIGGKRKGLGVFSDEISAAKAYDIAAIKEYGIYARTNFPEEDYT
jgi:hypothetical protein